MSITKEETHSDMLDTKHGNDPEVSSATSDVREDEEAIKKDPVIRLTLNNKRKPDGDEAMKLPDEKLETDDVVKGDLTRRLPRKKRKWLKKGESELFVFCSSVS